MIIDQGCHGTLCACLTVTNATNSVIQNTSFDMYPVPYKVSHPLRTIHTHPTCTIGTTTFFARAMYCMVTLLPAARAGRRTRF